MTSIFLFASDLAIFFLAPKSNKATFRSPLPTVSTIIEGNYDGVMLSNGPGDPSENVEINKEVKKLSESGLPIFAICLGHQLMALAHGFKTEK